LLSKNDENHAIAFAHGKVDFAIKVFNFPIFSPKRSKIELKKWFKNYLKWP